MNEQITNMIEKVKKGPTWLRAGVSAIPWAGGSLDHLLFDRADEIRIKNVEQTLESMKDCLGRMEEDKVSKEWFESEEALDMLKNLIQKIEFEGDSAKVKTLSNVYCLFGTANHKDDPNKHAVLETISKLTNNQLVVFRALNETPQEQKSFGEMITFTATAKWQSSILNYCNSHPEILHQLKGHVTINVELDILASFNLITNMNLATSEDVAYRVSELGKLAYSYLREVA